MKAKYKWLCTLHGYIAETSQQAADEFFPSYQYVMTQLGRERGWQPMTRQQFDAMRTKKARCWWAVHRK